MRPRKIDFENALNTILLDAKNKGHDYKIINSGQLHRIVGGYPDPKFSNMPGCCNVMRQRMATDDRIIHQPKKGNGATLDIQYWLNK
ncbi:MAG: hypothetical protein KAF40_07410 [Flavihumibacter sp.]|nr:hypothetical protein [Flavihumibacter sp.]